MSVKSKYVSNIFKSEDHTISSIFRKVYMTAPKFFDKENWFKLIFKEKVFKNGPA